MNCPFCNSDDICVADVGPDEDNYDFCNVCGACGPREGQYRRYTGKDRKVDRETRVESTNLSDLSFHLKSAKAKIVEMDKMTDSVIDRIVTEMDRITELAIAKAQRKISQKLDD